MFTGRTDAEAPIISSPDSKNQPTGKDPHSGKDCGQEDEMVEWHHPLSEHEFEQTPGDSEGQGSLVCCNPWGHKELDMTEQMTNNNK